MLACEVGTPYSRNLAGDRIGEGRRCSPKSPSWRLVALVSNFFLLGDPLWNTLFGIQMVFYGISFFGMVFGRFDLPSLLKIPFYFCMVNTAILWGLFKGLLGLQKVTWKKADRDLVSVPPK